MQRISGMTSTPLLRTVLAAGVASLLVLRCGGRSATENRTDTLLLVYEEPASFPPSGDPGCTHHNATAFLDAATDWGATGRLQPRDGSLHSLTLDMPAAGDHWLQVSDYRFCSTRCAVATTGLSVNTSRLVRLAPPDDQSCPVVWFRVNSDGTVSP